MRFKCHIEEWREKNADDMCVRSMKTSLTEFRAFNGMWSRDGSSWECGRLIGPSGGQSDGAAPNFKGVLKVICRRRLLITGLLTILTSFFSNFYCFYTFLGYRYSFCNETLNNLTVFWGFGEKKLI